MDNDSEREDCECDSNYGTLFRAFMRQYFYQGFIFTILCFSREEVSSLSPRPLFKNKRKNARSKVRLFNTIFRHCRLSPVAFSVFKKILGGNSFSGHTKGKNNCHRNTQISSVGHFRTSHPLEFPSQWSLSYPAPTPRISAIFSRSDPGIQAGSPEMPKTLKQYEKRYPNQSDIAILENEKTLETRLSQRC